MNNKDTKQTGHGADATIETTVPQPCWLLKTARAPKLGKQAEGGIGYQIVTGSDRKEPMIQIVSNDSGGYFSKEAVYLSRVAACVDQHQKDQSFPSKLLQTAFTGRSSNNAGFLAAILRAEGLLAVAPDAEGRHVISGDWTAWKASTLAVPGQAIDAEPADKEEKADASEPPTPPRDNEKAATRRGKK